MNYNYHIRVDGNNHHGLPFYNEIAENEKEIVTPKVPFNFDGAVTDFEVIKCKPRMLLFGYEMLINGVGFIFCFSFH